jgi:hypothetical protein
MLKKLINFNNNLKVIHKVSKFGLSPKRMLKTTSTIIAEPI